MSEHCTMVYSLLKLSVKELSKVATSVYTFKRVAKNADAGKDGVLTRPDKRQQAVTFNCKQAWWDPGARKYNMFVVFHLPVCKISGSQVFHDHRNPKSSQQAPKSTNCLQKSCLKLHHLPFRFFFSSVRCPFWSCYSLEFYYWTTSIFTLASYSKKETRVKWYMKYSSNCIGRIRISGWLVPSKRHEGDVICL